MSNRGESRGIYADLASKRQSKYDTDLEARVREWIEGVIGRPISGPFREGLMDGTVVCELINKLSPGLISKVHRSPIVMFRRENFGFFQNACVKLGVKSNETAVFEDVYEDRNMGQFLINIIALARVTQYKPGYGGPILADARQESSGAPGPSAAGKKQYIASFAEEAQKVALDAKESSRYVQHGILSNPEENLFHGQKDGKKGLERRASVGPYVPSAQDLAADVGVKAVEETRYREHGIIMNPDEVKKRMQSEGVKRIGKNCDQWGQSVKIEGEIERVFNFDWRNWEKFQF
jgi:hypothetical protein